MRKWQRSFWGVLALLLSTTCAQTQTDKPPDPSPALTDESQTMTSTSKSSHGPNLTFPLHTNTTSENPTSENPTTRTENGESPHNNYTNTTKLTHALSNNNNSHPTDNESTRTHGQQLTRAGNLHTSHDYAEIEQRLSPDHVMFDRDSFTSQSGSSDSGLETREIQQAADYGLRKMHELVNVREPELYTKDHVMFDRDSFTSQSGSSDSGLETREIQQAADYGLRKMHELVNVREPELYTKGLWLQPNTAAGRVAAFSAPVPQAQQLARFGYAAVQASSKLLQQWLGGAEGRAGPVLRLPAELRGSLRGTSLQRQCRVLTSPTPCRPASRRYRTADGSCNNLHRPRLGAALTPLQRFLAPRYVDGVQAVRTSLPSPRLISTRVHRPRHVESPSITLMLMQWGQLLDHDVTSTPGARAFNGSTPRCCGDGGRAHLPQNLLHPECLPITVPSDDPVMDRFTIRCMEFVRSAPVPREDCDFGHRQQMNQVTSYIDASTIYGSSTAQADGIRIFRGGLIRFGLPDPPNGGEPCRLGAVSSQCLRPGDARASEQPALTALHITWVRNHNQIASGLAALNPHWSDEKLYQEARRLVAASMQHITYREFLPIILGHEVVRLFDLELLHKGYYNGYDQRVNPSPANSFSAAAYRFGHSLVQDSFVRSDRFHRPIFNNVSLHDEQSNTDNIWSPGSVDRLILGLVNQPSQKRDEFISVELTNHLFQAPGSGSNSFGLDLAAINIQRGRDHGLPSYTAWRQPCGLSPIRNWTDLQRIMSVETTERFRSLYLNVEDIDLYSAGLAERPVRGGLVGPTFACIIAQQFSNLRKGDRFWYENGNFESSFTSAQLQQIRKITLSQILCQAMPEIETLQPFVFLSPDNFENRREACKNLVDFDLTPWTENFSNEDQSNKFPRPIQPILENGVENKIESNISANIKEKHPKLDSQQDEFSFSMSSIKLQTNQKIKTDELVKQTVFRRDKRQTDNTSDLLPSTKNYDNIEHRELDDTNSLTSDVDSTDATVEMRTADITDTDTIRNERKRKRRPSTNKSKPKPSTQRPDATTVIGGIKIKAKNKTNSDLKQMFYGTNNYYAPPYPPTNEEILVGTRRPSDNLMTYLFNTVRKTSTATTTTPKPDYQFHIQINYFYNSTTESYPRPTQPTNIRRPTYNYDRPAQNFDYNKQTASYTYNYNKPYTHNKPNSYSVHETDYPSGSYSGQNYANDKIDFAQSSRYTTRKPPGSPSNPITVIEINPQNLQKPEHVNRPNIYIVNDNFDQPLKPTYDYNQYRPQTHTYETKPETLVYKRPVTGITKLDSKPIVVYEQAGIYDHKQYGTEVVYDNEYLDTNRRPTYQRPDPIYTSVHDKLDFNNKQYVKVSSTKKHVFSTPKPRPVPYETFDDKRYVRISTVKGHTTQTDLLSPVYFSVQNKESDDDLEMAYDDILEVYMKPDGKSAILHKNSDDLKTLPSSEKTEPDILLDDTCSTELPRPMDLLIEDDLLGL